MRVKATWCKEIKEINNALDSKGKTRGFEGLTSVQQIISVSYDGTLDMYLVVWKVSDGNLYT